MERERKADTEVGRFSPGLATCNSSIQALPFHNIEHYSVQTVLVVIGEFESDC